MLRSVPYELRPTSPTRLPLGGPVGKTSYLRTKDSVKTLTVPSIEELNTRSMSVFARPCDFLVAVGTHAPVTILSQASSPSRHFVARARMGLRGGVRACIHTVSIMVHGSLDAVAREKSPVLTPAVSRVRTLSLFLRRWYLSRSCLCSDSHAVFTGT